MLVWRGPSSGKPLKSGVWLGKSNQYFKYAKIITNKCNSNLDEFFFHFKKEIEVFESKLRRQGHQKSPNWPPLHWLTELLLQWRKFVEFSFSLRRRSQWRTLIGQGVRVIASLKNSGKIFWDASDTKTLNFFLDP